MSLLLDTHVLLWWLTDDERLPGRLRAAVAEPDTEVLVSAASTWEVSVESALGKLVVPDDLLDELRRQGFTELPVTAEDGLAAGALPRHHDDPFDRMLIAQAVRRDLLLLTVDRRFSEHEVRLLWSGLLQSGRAPGAPGPSVPVRSGPRALGWRERRARVPAREWRLSVSELDLNAPLTPPAGATGSAVGPNDLVLAPPTPVPVVPEEQAAGMVAVDPAKKAELAAKAEAFAADLASQDPQSPAFTKKVDDIVRMGEQEIRASAQASNRMLERPASSLAAAQGRGPAGDAQTRVAKTLGDLRTTVTDLDPGRAELSGKSKFLGIIPGGKKLTKYFQRYQSAQQQLDGIIKALASGQDELRKDNASIEQEKVNLWATMGRLSEYATLASALDAATQAKVEQLRYANPKAADALTSDALFPIRQRRQDLMTQIAVSVQGYLAMEMVRKNNIELIKGVDRAQTTTVAALRTAVIVAQALDNQRLVLDQINALNETTNTLIGRTGELLKQQTGMIHEQASSSGVSVETLQKAFDDVFATMDAVDTYRAKAVESMGTTVTALEGQIARSRSYLDRARASETRQGELGG